MLNERTGASKQDYVRAFDRRNLCDLDAFMVPPGSTVVLLGEDVRRWFGLPKILIHPQVRDGVTYRQVPHPSGLCRFYNHPAQRELVALLLGQLYEESQDA